ncbi:ribbon-helix-helix protein, CopG family [Caballeronia sp. LZ033]|nr:ribbon-helix-helix protein, CopG family [Caballeronia sp. LZ033]MDR5813057.1 ribbon-helix-helix protein, CopG family [Caballeronia sp. LZ033]
MERFNVNIPAHIAEQLRKIAQETGATVAELIRRATYEFVKSQPKG